MRLYVYVSEAVKLSDLVPILETSKALNAAHGISGILSYNHGHYLQVIEGEQAEVDELVINLKKDPRHQNFCEVLNVEIEDRFFSDWSMNLVPLLKRNESFLNFISFLNQNIDLLDRTQNRLFNIFYEIPETQEQAPEPVQYASPLVYSINEWPNFDVIEPSSCLMSLCGSIMNNPTRFAELEKRHFYGSEKQLRAMLNDLNRAGYLKVTMSQNTRDMDRAEPSNIDQGSFNKWRGEAAKSRYKQPQLSAAFG